VIFLMFGLSSCAYSMDNGMNITPGKHFYYKDHIFLNYQVGGHGQRTIIFLHGFGASGLTWKDLMPYLDDNRYRYIIFDLIGSGYSSKPHNADYSMTANADAIISFINKSDLSNYLIVGHSFGGGVALLATIKSIEGASKPPKGIVLLDAAAYSAYIPFFVDGLRTPVLGPLLLSLTSAEFQARFTLDHIYFDKQKVTDEIVGRYTYFMRMPGHDYALVQTAKQVASKEFDQLTRNYDKLRLPALVLWGSDDPVLPLSLGERLTSDLPNAKLQIIQNCGHNIQEECPGPTAAEINIFLDEITEQEN
jgi:pimeloyl-ACP methyl ester carboxylesterase